MWHAGHPTVLLNDQIIAAQHFGQSTPAGGRQHAHPHPAEQYQNLSPAPVRTSTASRNRHRGQVRDHDTHGRDLVERPNPPTVGSSS